MTASTPPSTTTPLQPSSRGWITEALPAGVAVFLLVLFVQWRSQGLLGFDGYYHVRMGELYASGELAAAGAEFHWTRFSLWNGQFVDKDFLLHLVLAPFAWLAGDDITRLEWAGILVTALMAAGFACIAARVFRGQGVRWPLAWTLLLFSVSELFVFRVSMCRSHVFSTAFALLGWHLLTRRSRWGLFCLGVLYTLAYTAPHLLVALTVLWAPFELFGARDSATWRERLRLAGAPILLASAGILVGLLVHPLSENLARLWVVQNLIVPLSSFGWTGVTTWLADSLGVAVSEGGLGIVNLGLEIQPPKLVTLLQLHQLGLVLLVAPGVLSAVYRLRPEREDLFAHAAALCSFAAFLSGERFAEYFFPFVVLASARLTTRLLEAGALSRWASTEPRRKAWALAAVAALALNLGLRPWNTARIAQRGRAEPAFTEKLWLRGAAEAIQREVPPGEAVFHASWPVFTQLFFLAPTHDYVVGLDPTFFAVHDPALYRRYELLRTGRDEHRQLLTRPERIIREEFGMAFALVLPAVERRLASELRRAQAAGRVTLLARHRKDRWRLYALRPPR